MKPKAKRRIKRLWNKRARKSNENKNHIVKLVGRQVGGQYVERRPGGGLIID